jgi:hypothetical protein
MISVRHNSVTFKSGSYITGAVFVVLSTNGTPQAPHELVSFETSRTITCAILFLETAGIGLGMKLGHGWSNEASGIMFGISGGVLVGCLTLPNAKPTERRVLRNRRRY